jgi:hypothetical protein
MSPCLPPQILSPSQIYSDFNANPSSSRAGPSNAERARPKPAFDKRFITELGNSTLLRNVVYAAEGAFEEPAGKKKNTFDGAVASLDTQAIQNCPILEYNWRWF